MTRGVPGTKSPHGSPWRYKNHGCRCRECTSAWSSYHVAYLHRTGRTKPRDIYLAELRANPVHGTEGGYIRGCRCEPCRVAAREARKERRHRNAEADRAYQREYRRRRKAA